VERENRETREGETSKMPRLVDDEDTQRQVIIFIADELGDRGTPT